MPSNRFDKNVQTWKERYDQSYDISFLENIIPGSIDREESSLQGSEWIRSLPLQHIQVLYVFGIIPKDYFSTLKDWLEDSSHYLIIIENQPKILRSFLETEEASALLSHLQVRFYYLDNQKPDDLLRKLGFLFAKFQFFFTRFNKEEQASEQIFQKLNFWHQRNYGWISEYMEYGEHVFANFFPNLALLPASYLANRLFGRFSGIPAIICGAGASLDNNLEILRTLENYALIFASGSAMNAINSANIIPHFGIGIDPNSVQLSRLLMNSAFEVPFFYRLRMHSEAIRLVQGPTIYINGSTSFELGSWIDHQLEIDGPIAEEGLNVVNLTISLAHLLGCNPIIFVGMDLGYTDKKNYHKGVIEHPIHAHLKKWFIESTDENILLQKDIHGNAIYTNWKWKAEASWISDFASRHKDVLFINATEGGIGMEGIVNRSLSDLKEQVLIRQLDLRAFIHGELQNATMPSSVNTNNLLYLLVQIANSLQQCREQCRKISNSPQKQSSEKLQQETAYQTILKEFEGRYLQYFELEIEQLKNDKSGHEKYDRLMAACYEFLFNTALVIEKILLQAKPRFHEIKKCDKPLIAQNEVSNGTVKMSQTYLHGLLHGKVFYYSHNGVKLTESQFVNGIQEGQSIFYYTSGNIYALQLYLNGKMQGVQKYFFENGQIKTILPYNQGILNGTVLLYYQNGQIKREINYLNGKRQGIEKHFYEDGHLLLKCEYNHDRPIGSSTVWHENGQAAQIICYDNASNPLIIQRWNQQGVEIQNEPIDDFFDQVEKKTLVMTHSLKGVTQALEDVFSTAKLKDHRIRAEIGEDFNTLKNKLHYLEELSKNLFSSETPSFILRSQETRKELQKKIQGSVKQFEQFIDTMQQRVKDIKKQLEE